MALFFSQRIIISGPMVRVVFGVALVPFTSYQECILILRSESYLAAMTCLCVYAMCFFVLDG